MEEAIDFYIFTLLLGILLTAVISCNSFSVMPSEFSRCTIVSFTNKNTFSSFKPIVYISDVVC